MTVIKIGGSVLFPGPRVSGFTCLNGTISRLKNLKGGKIIVHGTGFFGKKPAKDHDYHRDGVIDPLSMPVEKIRLALLKAHCVFLEFLVKKGLRAVSLDPASIFSPGKKLALKDFSPVKRLFAPGLVPVVRGDVLFFGRSARAVSSDEMAQLLSLAAFPERTVFITNTKGLLGPGGKTLGKVLNSRLPAVIAGIRPSSGDVSGGMRGKMLQVKKISDAGIDVLIGNAFSDFSAPAGGTFEGTFIYGKKKNKRHNPGL